MWVALSNQLHHQTVIHHWHRTHTHNSPATSRIVCHTSQLCAQEVGITNHPPLRIKPALKTAKQVHTHKQHANNTQATQKFTAKLSIVESHLQSWDLWVMGPPRFRCATLIAEINCRRVTLLSSANRYYARRTEELARRAESLLGVQITADNADDRFLALARRATHDSEQKSAKTWAERERTRFRRKLDSSYGSAHISVSVHRVLILWWPLHRVCDSSLLHRNSRYNFSSAIFRRCYPRGGN